MSDTIKKWHEMQEDLKEQGSVNTGFPYNTVTIPKDNLRRKAFTLLCNYDEDVIRLALKILDGLENE